MSKIEELDMEESEGQETQGSESQGLGVCGKSDHKKELQVPRRMSSSCNHLSYFLYHNLIKL